MSPPQPEGHYHPESTCGATSATFYYILTAHPQAAFGGEEEAELEPFRCL